jgi:hypothetical protein
MRFTNIEGGRDVEYQTKAFLARREKELEAAGPVVKIVDSYVYGQEAKKLQKAGVLVPGTFTEAGAKKCPHVIEALVVAGTDAGHTRKICTAKKCPVHKHQVSSRAIDYGRAAETPAEKEKRRKEAQARVLEDAVKERAALEFLRKAKAPLKGAKGGRR